MSYDKVNLYIHIGFSTLYIRDFSHQSFTIFVLRTKI